MMKRMALIITGICSLLLSEVRGQCYNTFLRSDSICAGDTFFQGSSAYTISGNYIDTLPGTSCDSILQLTLHVLNPPVADAGADIVACGGEVIGLDGSVLGAASNGEWLGGLGTFPTGRNDLDGTYIPDESEYGDTLKLYLQTNDPAGPCPAAIDSVYIYVIMPPSLIAPASDTGCTGFFDLSTLAVVDENGSIGSYYFYNALPLASPLSSSIVSNSGLYYILKVTNTTPSCFDTISVWIEIDSLPLFANAGADIIVCGGEEIGLDGSISGAASSGEWLGGLGTFPTGRNDLDGTYIPDTSEYGDTLTLYLQTNDPDGPCPAAIDSVKIYVIMPPSLIAPASDTGCTGFYDLSTLAVVDENSTTGSFYYYDSLPLVSPLSSSIVSNSGLYYILKVTNTTPSCFDTVSLWIEIDSLPLFAHAGADIVACGGEEIGLDGSISGAASSGEWLGGLGTFPTGRNDLDGTYIPDASEYGDTLTLYLQTNNPAGFCPAAIDSVKIYVIMPPSLIAPASDTGCTGFYDLSTLAVVDENGSIGSYYYYDALPLASPLPSSIVSSSGLYYILKVTNTTPSCFDTVSVWIEIDSLPLFANAGADIIVCGAEVIGLDGSISGAASSGEWLGGLGTFPTGRNDLDGTYIPDASEYGDTLTLYLQTNDPAGHCPAAIDSVNIYVIMPPSLIAPVSDSGCGGLFDLSTLALVDLNATSGSFAYYDSLPLVNPLPGPEVSESGIYYILKYTNTTPTCFDTVQVNIHINPQTVNAGSDITVCSGEDIGLVGSISGNASSAMWHGGVGVFVDGRSSPTGIYIPDPSEYGDTLVLQLISNDLPGSCAADTDRVSIVLIEKPNLAPLTSGTGCSLGFDLSLLNVIDLNATAGSVFFYDSLPLTVPLIDPVVHASRTYYVLKLTNTTPSCFDTTSVEVVIKPSSVTTTTGKNNISCNNINNGTASVSVGGGLSPFSYLWSTGQTTSVISSLAGGPYTVTVTDSEGCTKSTSLGIFNPSPIFTFAFEDPVGSGNINLLVSGGVNPYSYIWSTGEITEDVFGKPPGFYFCQVTDRNGCGKIQVYTISAINPFGPDRGRNLESEVAKLIPETESVFLFQPIIFPNPNKGSFTIRCDVAQECRARVSVLDLKGSSLRTSDMLFNQGSSVRDMDVGELTPGIYILEIRTDGMLMREKLIIE